MKDGCYNLLLAAAACPWPDRSAIGYLKWATCVADLDSGALALTKEASGNSRGVTAQVGMVLGTGLHLGVRPCQTEGVTAQDGNIAGYRGTPGCQTM